MLINSANFLKSASKPSECPSEDFPEFAFIGRSNVGKSSLINMLTERKKLAKVSVTPGKTELLNYFLINNNRYLVDLPGYGYAKKSKAQRIAREKVMWNYFMERTTLKTVFLLIDGSILPQHIDLEFVESLVYHKVPFEIIVTKTDKTNQKNLHKHSTLLQKEISKLVIDAPKIFYVSNTKRKGKEKILDFIQEQIEEKAV